MLLINIDHLVLIKKLTKKFKTDFKFKSWVLSAPIFIFAIGCQAPKVKESTEKNESWNTQMRSLEQELTLSLPLAADPNLRKNPEKVKALKESLKKVSLLSKDLNHSSMNLKRDPSFQFLTQAFHEDADRIVKSLEADRIEFAQFNVLNLTSYCIQCHTGSSVGVQFNSAEMSNVLARLSEIEKADYLVSTRQFEAAFEKYKSIITTQLSRQSDVFILEKSLRTALSLSVSNFESPEKTLELFKLFEGQKRVPFGLQSTVRDWRADVGAWQKESKVQGMRASQVSSFVKRGDQKVRSSGPRSGDIFYLRAISLGHKLLAVENSVIVKAQLLLDIGNSYAALRNYNTLNLQENYFESCIRVLPNSKVAGACFAKLSDSIEQGYTGSSGTNIPDNIKAQLAALKKLAVPL